MIPWKVITTVASLTIVAVAALAFGVEPLAYAAAGAIIGYLGKVNGSRNNR